MQENFVLKAKKAIKKIAAIGAGTAMLGMTVGSALAMDLATDYPNSFVDNLAIVVGSEGSVSEDSIGAIDLAFDIQYNAKTCVPSGGTTVTVTGGVTEDIPLGLGIADSSAKTLDTTLEDDDIDTLLDTTVTFQSSDYDVSELIVFGQDSKNVNVSTSLTASDDDYETDVVLEVERDAIKYYYAFDETIQPNLSTTSDPLEIKFLGKTLKITSISTTAANKFTAYVGTEYFLNVGDSVTVEGKKVTLSNVGSGGAIVVEVDGVTETIASSGTETVNGIEISNDETFYEDNKDQRSATLFVGKDAQETYTDGDPYIGEDDTDPMWIWDIDNLNTNLATTISSTADASTTGPKLGIENDFYWNDDSDNPAAIGDCIDLPNNYVSICADSLTVADDNYATFTIEFEDSGDFSKTFAGNSSVGSVYIHTPQTEGMLVDYDQYTVANLSKDEKTDSMWLFGNGTDMWVLYEDTSANKPYYAGSVANATDANIADVNYDNTKGDDLRIYAWTDNDYINVTFMPYEATDLPFYDDNITIVFNLDSNGEQVSSLGATLSSEEANELYWTGPASTTIGTKDEDHRTKYGIIVRDPKSHGASDEVVLEIPGDQVQANIVVKGTAATTSSASGETCTVAQVTPTNLLSNEVSDPTMYNLILVGGPRANPLVTTVFGIAGDAWPLSAGEAMVRLAANGEKLAMVVAGTTAIDTRRAAKAIRSGTVSLSGTEAVLATVSDTVTVKEGTA